jgi:putative ABC transport system permease protein
MVSLLWRKIIRDFWIVRGRMLMMVIAIAVGIFGVTTILSAYTILDREVRRNYLGTNPASAQLQLDKVDDVLVDKVRQRPGIADAEASSAVFARIEKKPNEWLPLLLFVIKDFNTMRINTFTPVSGTWPPPEGTILLEKEAMPILNAKIGDTHRIQTPNGLRHITISGLVHDPGLAPAWQEQTAYGYITPSTLVKLGESSNLHILKITVKDQPFNKESIEKTAGALAAWLKQQGYEVDNIRIPPPGMHPHQSQMNSILMMLLIFSFLALILSAILTATLIGGLLAGQVRQIGIMKSVGARSGQISEAYIIMILLLCIVAIVLGLPSGIAVGRGFAKIVAGLLNLKLYGFGIPGWVYWVLLFSGILVPFQVAHHPIMLTSRITVHEAINDFGVSRDNFGSNRLDTILGKIRGMDRTLILALRNTFRRRGRLILTLSLLAAAGGMFMTSLNVKTSWEYYIRNASANRHYDLEIHLNRPESEPKILDMIKNVPGVQKVEIWNMIPAAVNRPDGLDIERTYPDGGHGSFTLRSVPSGSKLVQSPVISGRWLRPEDKGAVVLNHMARMFYPDVKVGDPITVNIDGHITTLKVVGITREILTPATAYVNPDTFFKITGQQGKSNTLRVAMSKHDLGTIKAVTKQIERVLEKENVSVKMAVSESMLDGALNGHVYIFVVALILTAMIMAVVGALGLMSTMGTNVTERTREFGVMRTIGGKSGTVIRNVILEGVLIGLMSWVIGIVLSLPISAGIDNLIGNMSFRSPLPMILAPKSIIVWLIIIVCGAIAASAYPAWKASRLTVRETLSYN